MEKIAVHFGGGALGRGLVVPFLMEAGFDVVIVDVNKELLDELKKNKEYFLEITDYPEHSRVIKIKDAVELSVSNQILSQYLARAEIITTSVRKENLPAVAEILSKALHENDKKIVLCAENIENSGDYFKSLIETVSHHKYKNFMIPNTVVDRICSSKWPESTNIMTESYGEFGFEKGEIQESLKNIKAVDDLEKAFIRKRLLVNTYCDMCCFFGKIRKKKYLSDAVTDQEVQKEVKPYAETFKTILVKKYHYTEDEIDQWICLYQKRLANPAIKRELETVARGLWQKLKYSERFLLPILLLDDMGEDTEEALRTLCHMIDLSTEGDPSEKLCKLQKLWAVKIQGEKIYQRATKYFN